MKKLALILAALMLLTMLAACTNGGSTGEVDPTEVVADSGNGSTGEGEVYDTGEFSMLIPAGWLVIPSSDLFKEYDGEHDPTSLSAYKGATSEWEAFSKPGLKVYKYGADHEYYDMRDMYENAQDVAPFQTGEYSWEGYTADSESSKIATLHTSFEGGSFEVSVWLSNGGDEITIDDADLLAILGSLKLTKN